MEALPSTAPNTRRLRGGRSLGRGCCGRCAGAPAWARRAAGERPPLGGQAGSAERSVGDREGRARPPPSFLPTPSPRASSGRGDPLRVPRRPPRPPARPRLLQPTLARAGVLALVPGLPSWAPAPRSPPPRGGRGPFHNSATRLPPPPGSRSAPARGPLGACALRPAAATPAPAAPFFFFFFLKGNAEAPGVTVGEGDPEPRRPPGEAADLPPSRSRRGSGRTRPSHPPPEEEQGVWGGGGGNGGSGRLRRAPGRGAGAGKGGCGVGRRGGPGRARGGRSELRG